ncbi:MAG: APC family permease [Planctomycetes bacterium]|nr:APC family permease [Planctomycetota bacterium]
MSEIIPKNAAPRRLGAGTCVLIGLTTIVGGGIYALPPLLVSTIGPLSFLSFAGATVVAVFIGLMTAEAGGTTEATGGAYQYARVAFGPPVGFAVAWLGWASNIIAWTGISIGLAKLLDFYEPGLGSGENGKWIATGEIVIFGIINIFGAKPGARVSNVITVVKLLPLFFFIAIGLLVFDTKPFEGGLQKLQAAGAGGIAITIYRCFFAASGFENIGVIAGDVVNPKRAIPRAVLIAIVASSALYAFIQISAVASGANLSASAAGGESTTTALPIAAREIGTKLVSGGFGRAAFLILLIGAAVSMAGFCAGIALVAPRYLFAMAGDGFLPKQLIQTDKDGTPRAAIAVVTAIAAALVWRANWLDLLDTNVLIALFQHSITILAAWRLRFRIAREGRFIAPGGPATPLIALGLIFILCLFAFQQPPPEMAKLVQPISLKQFQAIAIILGTGALIAIISKELINKKSGSSAT